MAINVQKKGREDILRKQCIEKVNADPDEIDISSDNSDLEDNHGRHHIEAIEEENPQISSFSFLLNFQKQVHYSYFRLSLLR